jgi:hypothetical protein
MMTDHTNATRVKGTVELNMNCGWFTVFPVKLQPTILVEIYILIIDDRPPLIHEFLIDTAFYFFSLKEDRPQALYDC